MSNGYCRFRLSATTNARSALPGRARVNAATVHTHWSGAKVSAIAVSFFASAALPASPQKARCAIHPRNPISSDRNQDTYSHQSVRQTPIDAICSMVGPLIDGTINQCLNAKCRNRKHKCHGHIDRSPPFGECRCVFRKTRANREHPRQQERNSY